MVIKKGSKLWKKAKTIIPGGTQLLSKRPEMFLPDQWPTYFSRAKGIKVEDIDGNKFIDMSYMGIGACVLGYADSDVDGAVINTIKSGIMCTLNSPEEVELAEILLRMHPWAGMVRYARTGGEAMAIAVRIARAFTKKDQVAFCGYHGWHDWYLAANLADNKNLDGHLLPGLNPLGVPRCLKGTSIPFHYNDLAEFNKIIKNNDIGVIVMEPVRDQDPEPGFLDGIRKVANKIGAVLIFDEITSGFRTNLGGAHEKYGVTPDIVVYGKALGNGYPISAILGKNKIMDVAQESFISSTFWTERIGPTAAIATLKKMKRLKVQSHLVMIGKRIQLGWKKLAEKHGLNIKISSIPPLAHFSFEYGEDSQALYTLFNQEMMKKGFLTSKSVYVSYSHKKNDIDKYLNTADEVFNLIKKAIDDKKIYKLLKGPIAHSGFARLT
jgi:glutamate-1-semialdehyde aminotransferase